MVLIPEWLIPEWSSLLRFLCWNTSFKTIWYNMIMKFLAAEFLINKKWSNFFLDLSASEEWNSEFSLIILEFSFGLSLKNGIFYLPIINLFVISCLNATYFLHFWGKSQWVIKRKKLNSKCHLHQNRKKQTSRYNINNFVA